MTNLGSDRDRRSERSAQSAATASLTAPPHGLWSWAGHRRKLLLGGAIGGASILSPRPAAVRRSAAAEAMPGAATPISQATPAPIIQLIDQDEQPPRDQGPPIDGGHLRLDRPPASRDDFSPVSLGQDFQVAVSYLDPLLRPDPNTLEPTPWLAERWMVEDDGRLITYRLRSDVRWHDGSPLTAADVRFSFTVYRDDLASAVRNFFTAMVEIEAPDEITVRVTLAEPDSGWLFNASSQLIFQRAQYLEHWTSRPIGERTLGGFDWNDRPPIGSGPWRLTDWNRDGVDFARNEDYWAGAPHFARFSIGWRETAADRLRAWEAGDTDALWPVRARDIDRVAGRSGRLFAVDAASVMFAAFNFDNPERAIPTLFDDPSVRRALSLAIDRANYAEEVFGGFSDVTAAGSIAQPWARDTAQRTPPRDLREARRLLTEAGWEDRDGDGIRENGDGLPFTATAIFQADGRPELGRVLALVAEDLTELGVELAVEPLPEPEFLERWLETRAFDLIAYAYDLYPGFTDFDLYGSAWDIRFNPQGWNPGGYANQRADEAIDDALAALEVASQRSALIRLQEAVNDDLFAVWLGFPQDLVLVGAHIRAFSPNKLWQTADTASWWRAP